MKLHPLLFEPSEEIGTSVRSEPELPSCFKISEDLKNVVEEIDQEGGEETDFNFSLLNLNGEVLQTCSLKLHISPARSDSSMENSEVADKVPEVSETEPQSASVEPQESDGHQISINDANKEAVQDGTNVIPDDHGSDSVNAPDATVASVSNSAEVADGGIAASTSSPADSEGPEVGENSASGTNVSLPAETEASFEKPKEDEAATADVHTEERTKKEDETQSVQSETVGSDLPINAAEVETVDADASDVKPHLDEASVESQAEDPKDESAEKPQTPGKKRLNLFKRAEKGEKTDKGEKLDKGEKSEKTRRCLLQ
eukprot:Filipodium_phascolosomae@DN564_c0_g1_i2.p1